MAEKQGARVTGLKGLVLASGLLLAACAAGPKPGASAAADPSPPPFAEAEAAEDRVLALVDPFIGTDGTGHTFPGPVAPFGMVQPGPDNADYGWDFTSGYQFNAPQIWGISQTRASGTGIPELGDVLLMPMDDKRTGKTAVDFASAYDKASETAEVGYYAVTLADNNVRVELTAAPRMALHRYRFDAGGSVWVLVDLQHGLRFLDGPRVTGSEAKVLEDAVEGWVTSKNWTERTVAFHVKFDHPIAETEVLPRQPGDMADRFLLRFDLGQGRELQARVGLSSVDVDGARGNLNNWAGQATDFDTVRESVSRKWAQQLSLITIEADERTQRIFTTALYHTMIHPSLLSDADGRWRGPTGKVHQSIVPYYSTFSLWDTFRAAHPLYTLLLGEPLNEAFLSSLLQHSQDTGVLPLWTIWGGETGTMIGNPAMPVLADGLAKGFLRGLEREVLDAMLASSTRDHGHSEWSLYEQYGYYPFDKVHGGEAVSKTQEAGIGDTALARTAQLLGEAELADRFFKRAQNWKNLVDPETRLGRGRDSTGAWRTPFDPTRATSPLNNPGDYTEANAWQYSFTPGLYDLPGLIESKGGRADFTNMLDRFFELPSPPEAKFLGQEAKIGLYAHGNEPSHHIAWLYAFSERPVTGLQRVAQIARQFYADTPNGIIGNEDAGQMSAWYVFATLGFYPLDPSSAYYVLGLPLVTKAQIKLDSGKTLTIEADAEFVQARNQPPVITLNGVELDRPEISHQALMEGGVLRFSRP